MGFKKIRPALKDDELKVDGVDEPETLGGKDGTGETGGGTSEQEKVNKVPDASSFNPQQDNAYLQAIATLQQVQKAKPTYKDSYSAQLQDLYNQIVNRDKFSYDVNLDALYQQYKDRYVQQGKMAMLDTMGQAAALTGGYGSSYAQGVGQQAYQGYLQQLNDKVPELYDRALAQYTQEGQDLLTQYAMLGDMADDEYMKYKDSMSDYYNRLVMAKDDVDTAYDRAYNNEAKAYNKVLSFIGTDYTPTDSELSSAGLTRAQYDAISKSLISGSGDEGAILGGFTEKDFTDRMKEAASTGSKQDAQALVMAAGYTDKAWEIYHLYFGETIPEAANGTDVKTSAEFYRDKELVAKYGNYDNYLKAMGKK